MNHYLVIEDDNYFNKIITQAIISVDLNAAVHIATSLKEAKNYAEHVPVDVFIVDVQLPDGNGVAFAEALRRMAQYQCSPIIIETVVDNPTFQINSHNKVTYTSYITKPYDVSNMVTKINLANRFLIKADKKRLELKLSKKYARYFDIKAIVYIKKCKASKNIRIIMYKGDKLHEEELHRVSLNDVLEALENENDLIRCHKSYIVNPQYIETIGADTIILKNTGEDIPLGRMYSKTILLGGGV